MIKCLKVIQSGRKYAESLVKTIIFSLSLSRFFFVKFHFSVFGPHAGDRIGNHVCHALFALLLVFISPTFAK